jgi:hypothetical protein
MAEMVYPEGRRKVVTGSAGPIYADVRARFRWLYQRRVLDEVLPLPGGACFVICTRRVCRRSAFDPRRDAASPHRQAVPPAPSPSTAAQGQQELTVFGGHHLVLRLHRWAPLYAMIGETTS